jgi:hypothetical protein
MEWAALRPWQRISRAEQNRMNEGKHHCPACGKELDAYAAFPWRFCGACLEQAHDAEGRPLGFGNVDIGGGFVWYYKDQTGLADPSSHGVYCLIRGLPVRVGEVRQGGIVALPAEPWDEIECFDHIPVLCFNGPALHEARARLRPFKCGG